MTKRIFVTSLLAVLALASSSWHSFADTPPSAPVCYSMSYTSSYSKPRPTSLTYDVDGGVTVAIGLNGSPYTLRARLPLTIGDDPNPHFDRLYALLMKGFDNERIAEICVDRDPASSSEPVHLVSATLKYAETRKVHVCDPNNSDRCASVYGGELFTQ